ncbi:MAG TPA: tRNA pseudouridine(13) synthase TruD [Symbiobacteriaceae bacterium]|jgi:tRNA pseudouridine13 synthase|nr:tRNA pseudouridine(13) synthase TruD [Symbiobacteriaceae bacterium]
MRLKTQPEDFMVREATALRIRKQPAAPYRVYMLEKTGWNTTDALIRIAKEKRVPYERFGYGGKKDRHAHTYQYVTVQSPVDCTVTAKGYSLKALGFSAEPMEPAKILANHFELTVRELKPAEEAKLVAGAPRVRELGLPNYFDDQRFGNYDKERGFIAEKMLQGKWEEALNMAITAIYPEEHREAKERKRAMREQWGDWEACRGLAVTAFEQRSFDLLLSKPGAYKEALATVHKETALLWVSTYQSFLYNEILRRYLAEKGWAGASVPGPAGDYVFQTPGAQLDELVIPLPGKGMRFGEPTTGLIFEELLRERRLRPASLEGEVLPGIAFKASPRPALLRPTSLAVKGPVPDDLYPGHSKLALRFSLTRGSYATMVVKAMTAFGA